MNEEKIIVRKMGQAEFKEMLKGIKERYGITIYASYSLFGDIVTISKLFVPEGMRRQGLGTMAMNMIIQHCLEYGMDIALTPSTSWGISNRVLWQWYRKLGFVTNRGKDRDYRTTETAILTLKKGNG